MFVKGTPLLPYRAFQDHFLRPKKKKVMFPVSDRPYSEPPTLTFFFTFEEKKVKKGEKD